MKRPVLIGLVLVAVAAVTLVVVKTRGGKGDDPKGQGAKKAPGLVPVEVQRVETRDVQRAVNAVGSLEAFEIVQVTARVQGAVEKVSFREGDEVTAGQTLAEIEPARFQIAVNAAKAQLAKAQASHAGALASVERRAAVNEKNPGLIRGEELETFRTAAATADADLSGAKAALDQAQLNLRDAYVRAQVGGVIQTRTVQTGQYVQPGGVLATIVRKDPLLLRFQVPEQDAAFLAKDQPAFFTIRGAAQKFEAQITLVAGTANTASRLVAVTAVVTDERRESLRPGAFVELSVPVGGARAAPVIPQTAIRPTERGFLAYVVDGALAKERVVELGLATDDGLVEVKSGLAPGELLVVRGSDALAEGTQVKVTEEKQPAQSGVDSGASRSAP